MFEVIEYLLWSLFSPLLSSSSSSAVLNFLELMLTNEDLSYDSISLKYCVVQAVLLGWTTPIPWNNLLQSVFPELLGNKQFGWMKLLLTFEILSYDHSSINYLVFQAVRRDWTTPNSLNISPMILFSPLLSSSSSSAVLIFLELKKDSSIILVLFINQ